MAFWNVVAEVAFLVVYQTLMLIQHSLVEVVTYAAVEGILVVVHRPNMRFQAIQGCSLRCTNLLCTFNVAFLE